MAGSAASPSISIVVPAYNEEEVLQEFHNRTTEVLSTLGGPYEIVYINDGSTDRTLSLMHEIRDIDPNVTIVDLSRNFGKEIALTAGLDQSRGDVVIVIDADLQDPPELIPQFLAEWKNGFDIVYAVRTDRAGETWLKKTTALGFYRLIQSVSRVPIPKDTGDFRLMSRRAVDALGRLREQHRFMKGLFSWIGYPSKPIYYRRDARAAGETKWNYWQLWNFAVEGITSFSIAPLKIATYVGLATASISFVYAIYIVYKTLMFGDPIRGYPSLMVVILFLGGVQLVFTGVIGEYLGRVFDEVKQRPLYLLNGVHESRMASLGSTNDMNVRPTDARV
ncbi:glycosyltransferase family 2 protein [Thauera phenolivorans]|uniref:glycosyltransferase family 2 protein n=2 Tax=Thauera phenolivorans TaxID=1792543 RepID=UPI000B496D74|nr:glycosyltransferase family 2 protein [Thauera phenolivorans]